VQQRKPDRAQLGTKAPDKGPGREYSAVEKRLRERWLALAAEIRATRQRVATETHADIAGDSPDLEDEALADLIVDINNADLDRDVNEMREIQGAMERIAAGTYGVCTSCGSEISPQRLEAHPTAARCLDCQERYERTEPRTSTPAL
jgi:RNA polymerase-binding protein DksA